MMEWVTVTVRTVWVNAGDEPAMVRKWQFFADLAQIWGELGMHQAMLNPNTRGPDDECFTAGMRDLVLQHAPLCLFWLADGNSPAISRLLYK